MNALRFLYVVLTFLSFATVSHGQPASLSEQANGRFVGTASGVRAGRLNVTLDIVYAGGHFAGSLATPVGVFSIAGGKNDPRRPANR